MRCGVAEAACRLPGSSESRCQGGPSCGERHSAPARHGKLRKQKLSFRLPTVSNFIKRDVEISTADYKAVNPTNSLTHTARSEPWLGWQGLDCKLNGSRWK